MKNNEREKDMKATQKKRQPGREAQLPCDENSHSPLKNILAQNRYQGEGNE
jgi:hypothetical protein